MAGRVHKMAPGAITMARFKRLQALNPLFAQGGYTLSELAARFGVGIDAIAEDRDYIMDNWWREEEHEKTKDKRLQRLKELEQLKRLALESYHRSRHDKEEITTRFDKKPCEECGGTGRLPKCRCLNCDGIGYNTEEVVLRKISGQAGDASFLRVAVTCVTEMVKMEALYKRQPVKVQHVVTGMTHFLQADRLSNVDPNLIIDAKASIARLEQATLLSGENESELDQTSTQ